MCVLRVSDERGASALIMSILINHMLQHNSRLPATMRDVHWLLLVLTVQAVAGCRPEYDQCGGNGYTGDFTCCGHGGRPSKCWVRDASYSSCQASCPDGWACAGGTGMAGPGGQTVHNGFDDIKLPSSLSDAEQRWQKAAEEDPRLNSLLDLLQIVGVVIVLAALSFVRIRMKRSHNKALLSANGGMPMPDTPGGRLAVMPTPRGAAPKPRGGKQAAWTLGACLYSALYSSPPHATPRPPRPALLTPHPPHTPPSSHRPPHSALSTPPSPPHPPDPPHVCLRSSLP